MRYLRTVASYALRNRFGHQPVTQSGTAAVVSLTSYGKRTGKVHRTIESIGSGVVLPSRLILWLDDAAVVAHPPAALARLIKRGLEVRLTEDIGPHKKYYPYVASIEEHAVALVTADDDVFYPTAWLQQLLQASAKHPNDVICQRARVAVVRDGSFAPYADWPPSDNMSDLTNLVGIGVSGILYPPSFLSLLHRLGDRFKVDCPRADDLWLHVNALRDGRTVRQVGALPAYYQGFFRSQSSALWKSNMSDGNDAVIAQLYKPGDIALLKEESELRAGGMLR